MKILWIGADSKLHCFLRATVLVLGKYMPCKTEYDSLAEFSSSALPHWTPLHFVSLDALFMGTFLWKNRVENAQNFSSDGEMAIEEAGAS